MNKNIERDGRAKAMQANGYYWNPPQLSTPLKASYIKCNYPYDAKINKYVKAPLNRPLVFCFLIVELYFNCLSIIQNTQILAIFTQVQMHSHRYFPAISYLLSLWTCIDHIIVLIHQCGDNDSFIIPIALSNTYPERRPLAKRNPRRQCNHI